jgi:ribonucleotide reductase beta subunit family protein with ferritin-like domain
MNEKRSKGREKGIKQKKIKISPIATGLLQYSAFRQIADAIATLLSLFIIFPLQIALFYLFVKGYILEGLIFAVLYAFVVIFAVYKIFTRLYLKQDQKSIK